MTEQPKSSSPILSERIKLLIAPLWAVGFCFVFFSMLLPNNHFIRWQLFEKVPMLILNAIFPLQQKDVSYIGWSNLTQRFDILLVSAFMMVAAWALGSLLLRLIYPQGLLDRLERLLFSFAIGISAWSLVILLSGLMGILARPFFLGMMILSIFVALGQLSRKKEDEKKEVTTADQPETNPWLPRICLAVTGFFFLWMLLGALLPSTDFDVREYHLQGPKEFYQNGKITFLSHNVYTSFPFLTEMLTLWGMIVRGDWYWGALAGKAVLVCFAPLTALALFCAGRRWFSEPAGWLAAMIFMTTPWIHRISIIAYAEGGLTFFLFATLFAVMIALEKTKFVNLSQRKRQIFFAGLLAGSAMACKYPAALTVIIPMSAVVGIATWLSETETKQRLQATILSLAIMGAGVLIAIGPWLIKNSVETKNPLYPLVYSVFGSDQWNAEMDAKWKKAHSPSHHRLTGDRGMIFWMEDLAARSDWLSPLLYAFTPLAFLVMVRRRMIGLLWLYLLFLFFAWWGLTHRLDRFWVPMIPVVALLAGVGITWSKHISWKIIAGTCCAVAIFFNIGFNVSPLSGLNSFLYNYAELKQQTTSVPVALLNQIHQKKTIRVLSVGEAAVFEMEFPVYYNTVFDDSNLQLWTADPNSELSTKNLQMKSAVEIRATFKQKGITHIFVNWQEVLRNRVGYGYTDYITPKRFIQLQQMGIIGRPIEFLVPDNFIYRPLETFSDQEQKEITNWAPELISTDRQGEKRVITWQIFEIR